MHILQLKDFRERLRILELEESENVVTFPEISISKNQHSVIGECMFGWTNAETYDYYRSKIHGSLLLTKSAYVTREDQPDFQYLFDLGVKALGRGMTLENPYTASEREHVIPSRDAEQLVLYKNANMDLAAKLWRTEDELKEFRRRLHYKRRVELIPIAMLASLGFIIIMAILKHFFSNL